MRLALLKVFVVVNVISRHLFLCKYRLGLCQAEQVNSDLLTAGLHKFCRGKHTLVVYTRSIKIGKIIVIYCKKVSVRRLLQNS